MSDVLPDTIAGRTAAWVLERFGRENDPAELGSRFHGSFLAAVPAEQVAQVFASITGELTVVGAEGTQHEIQIGVRGDEGALIIQLAVTPEEPHLITGLLLRPAGPTVAEALAGAEPASDARAAIAEYLEPYAAALSGDGIGVAVAVRARGAELLVNLGAARDDSIFEIGSITKPITATLLARMVAARAVGLDDDVSDYGATTAEPVTLGQLATHTSGLPRLPVGDVLSDDGDPYAAFTAADLFDGLARTPIGARVPVYSNLGYALLGQVLARAAGTDYASLATREVLEPLAMIDARVGFDEALRARWMTPNANGAAVAHWTMDAMLPAGGVTATAADMLTFARAHLDAQEGSPPAMTHEPRARMAEGMHVGLAWIVQETAFGPVVWHNGGTGGFRTFMGFHRGSGTAIVALANSADGDGPDAAAAAVLGALARC